MISLDPIPSQTEDVAHEVIRCAIDVHRQLGPGFFESLYRDALRVEFTESGVAFETEKTVVVRYRDRVVGVQRLDFVIADCVLLELKAVDALAYVHKAQVLSYLRATRLRLGLLINFNVSVLKEGIRRVVN